jgi:hypothetical protein
LSEFVLIEHISTHAADNFSAILVVLLQKHLRVRRSEDRSLVPLLLVNLALSGLAFVRRYHEVVLELGHALLFPEDHVEIALAGLLGVDEDRLGEGNAHGLVVLAINTRVGLGRLINGLGSSMPFDAFKSKLVLARFGLHPELTSLFGFICRFCRLLELLLQN